MLAKVLLLLRSLHLADIVQQVIERPELFEEGGGEALADARHARDVVNRVAGQRQEVDDLVGPDAPFLLELGGVHEFILSQVEDPDLVADQLASILVGRDDENVISAFLGAPGEGRDHVVGLHAGLHDQTGTRNPSNSRRITGICGTRSTGISLRVALYSA